MDISIGKTFSTFMTKNKEIFVCGVNDSMQLGIKTPSKKDHLFFDELVFSIDCKDVVNLTKMEIFLQMEVLRIACGESHCLAVNC